METLSSSTPDAFFTALEAAQPVYATRPTPDAPNELVQCEKVARALGIALMPWQRLFLRVITEKLPSGAYRYPSVVLTVPRQCGKSTALLVLATTRALIHASHKTYYTAQTNMDAYSQVILEFWKMIDPSVFGKSCTIRRGNTAPKIGFPKESFISPFTPSPEGLHGKAKVNLVILDEVFSYEESLGNGILGAVQPAQLVAVNKQLILVSTKGSAKSTFFESWLKKGREATKDPDAHLAFFEWAMPEGLDPYDMANFTFHPAIGYTIQLEDVARLAETLSKGEYRRSVANIQTLTLESVLDLDKWNALQAPLSTPTRSEVAIGYEVSYDRSRAAIVAAWKHEKRTHIKVLATNKGTSWLEAALLQIHESQPRVMGADRYAQNLVIADQLAADYPDIPLVLLKPESAKTGAASFKAKIEDGALTHEGHLSMRQAVASAESRPMGEGWVFSHKSEPELLAAMTACRLLDEIRAESNPFTMVAE